MLVIPLIRKRCVALPVRSMAAPTVCRLAWPWHDIHSSYLEPKATDRLSVELLALASAGGNGAVHLGSPVSVTRGEPNPIVARTSLGCRHQRPARQPACTGAPRMIRGCRLYPSFSDSLSEKNVAQKQQVMFHTYTILYICAANFHVYRD
jgi:hypothetical protein